MQGVVGYSPILEESAGEKSGRTNRKEGGIIKKEGVVPHGKKQEEMKADDKGQKAMHASS